MNSICDPALRMHRFFSRHLFYPIALSTILVFVFFVARIYWSQKIAYTFLVWNLFLAWLPYIFSLTVAALHSRFPKAWWALFPFAALWLLFLPNAFYITTDLIHLKHRPEIPLWYDAGLLSIAAWTGIFLAVVSLQTFQEVVSDFLGSVAGWLFSLAVIAMSGYGVYLGRFLRWNSWDVLSDPLGILADSIIPFANPRSSLDKLVFITMYTSLFLVTYLTFSWMRPLKQPQ